MLKYLQVVAFLHHLLVAKLFLFAFVRMLPLVEVVPNPL